MPPFSQRIVDLGRVDAQLHAAKIEIVPDLMWMPNGGYYPVPGSVNRSVALDRAFALSNLWVVELFEIVRFLGSNSYPERAVGTARAQLKSLKRDLSLVRISLTKLQVAGIGRFIHYPKSLIGEDGSLGWRVRDSHLKQHVCTRRQFRDRFLELAHNYNKPSEGEM